MRCFFNLVDGHSCMLDPEGVEVVDLAELRAEVTKAIDEIRQADPGAPRDWNGWRMEVTDPKGAILLTVDLSPNRSARHFGLCSHLLLQWCQIGQDLANMIPDALSV